MDTIYFPVPDQPTLEQINERILMYPQLRYEEALKEAREWEEKYHELWDTLNPEIEKSTKIVQLGFKVATLTEENIAKDRMLRKWRRPLENQIATLKRATRSGMRHLEKKLQELGVDRRSALWCTTLAFGDMERMKRVDAQGADYQSEEESDSEAPQWWET